jgi:hypothetical protein
MIKIFVGTSPNGDDIKAERTLEYSLRKNCPVPIDITWMKKGFGDIFSRWNDKDWATPFTMFRWAIPTACDFRGRAIYMDVDQINIRNIADLFNIVMDKPIHARFVKERGKHETSVMVMDCAKLKPILPSLQELKIGKRVVFNPENIGYLDPRWNCLDGENLSLDNIWHLHFTFMDSQPWNPSWNKNEKVAHKRPDLVKYWNNVYNESSSSL